MGKVGNAPCMRENAANSRAEYTTAAANEHHWVPQSPLQNPLPVSDYRHKADERIRPPKVTSL